jgi:hypothetical protein
MVQNHFTNNQFTNITETGTIQLKLNKKKMAKDGRAV